jgi:hypothetical protein
MDTPYRIGSGDELGSDHPLVDGDFQRCPTGWPGARGRPDPEALTEYDAAILDRYFNYGVVQVRRLRQMDELGLAGEGWQDRIGYLRWHLGNEAGRRWWARTRGDEMGDEVIAAIDSILLDSDWNDNRELIESITRSESDPDR